MFRVLVKPLKIAIATIHMVRLTVHSIFDCSQIDRLSSECWMFHESIDCTLKVVCSQIIWSYTENVCYVMIVYFTGFLRCFMFNTKCFVFSYYEHSCGLQLFRRELQLWPPPMLEWAALVASEYSGVSCIYVSKMAHLIMMYPSCVNVFYIAIC